MNKEKNDRENLDMTKDYQNTCSCKKELKQSLDLLIKPSIKKLIDFDKFILIGDHFITGNLKTISNCTDLITYANLIDLTKPKIPIYTSSTTCDLIGVLFSLKPCQGYEFIKSINKVVHSIDPNSICNAEDDEHSCNISKALFLIDSVGPVNIKVSSSAIDETSFLQFNVIAVTNNIAWLINDNDEVLIICLNSIEQLG